ncbi:MAG: prolyl oligopeptidase family serine peptidase, partial [bacterium]
VGAAMTQRPELFQAVVCQVPLLDMLRYHLLLAGPSWIAEYGDPSTPEEYDYIKKYSPYQNLKRDIRYPNSYFFTTTKDDRVHPGHARKMVAKLNEYGQSVTYYENSEGGHGAGADSLQRSKTWTYELIYLFQQLMD